MSFDLIAWWTGAAVLVSGALLSAASLVVFVAFVAVDLATRHLKRLGNVGRNLHGLAQWVNAGRPVWTEVDGKMEMRPQPK